MVDFDLTIASNIGYLTSNEVLKMLLANTKRSQYCLVHLFSGQWFKEEEERIIHGMSALNGIFSFEKNIGATSIFGCGHDPWRVQCLLTFPHELAHSMGSPHDNENKTKSNIRSKNTFLMPPVNNMETPISAKNLKLSSDSITIIEDFLNQMFENFIDAKSKNKILL